MRTSLPLLALLAATAAGQSPQPGYTLFSPVQSDQTHLLDNAGFVAHTWQGTNSPGVAAYLKPNGNLLRTMQITFGPGGTGGRVQEIAWDGSLVWSYTVNSATELSHHDVEPLPNGNVLMVVWDIVDSNEAVAQGRDPLLLQSPIFRSEKIIEVEPDGFNGGNIVWEWRVWDHLVQDAFADKPNFGDPAANPGRVDLNFPPTAPAQGDWLHINGVDYDPVRDEISLSVPYFNELWVIDHSTTTEEAAGSSGGNRGQGGEILYRWGNSQAWGVPGVQQLFFQHDVTFVDAGFPGEGNFLLFNNNGGGPGSNFSKVMEIVPPRDPSGDYVLQPGQAYGPPQASWEYVAPQPSQFFSWNMSGAERLANGNTLICSAVQGWFFEVDPGGQVVWEHTNVLPNPFAPNVFKVRRYQRWLYSDRAAVSAGAGGSASLELLAGAENANRAYLLLGSASGTSGGFVLDGHELPLNPLDPYFQFTLSAPNGGLIPQSFGLLDANGIASTLFSLPAGVTPPALVGSELHHAYAVIDPLSGKITRTSNAQLVRIDP